VCLKLYHVWTFSNSYAFRRMKNKLNRPEYVKFSCPFAVVYVIKSYISDEVSTPEKRDRLPYKQLKALVGTGGIKAEVHTFTGWTWERFQNFLKEIPENADVFGKVVLEML